jgi:restriction system protein
MAVWLIRAGSHGEYEQKFIQENRVYVTWADLDLNLAELRQKSELTEAMTQRYPDAKPRAIANWVNQIWGFAHEIKTSDLVILSPATITSSPAGRVRSSTGAP